jgi:hypothetical protein
VLGEHHADGVDRIMAVEPFADQALRDTTRRRFISERSTMACKVACSFSFGRRMPARR